jgi:sugar/nucleoside kinase (ribokinase family)/nucleoside 2-deoxyribosyltransferase
LTDVVVIGGLFNERLPGVHRPTVRPGGSGYVAALTAAALGRDVALASFVGKDDDRSGAALRRAGVDTTAVQVLPGQSGLFDIADVADYGPPRPTYRPPSSRPAPEPPGDMPRAPVVLVFGFPDFDPSEWVAAALEDDGILLWDRQGWLSQKIDYARFASLPAARRVYVANLEEMREEAETQMYFSALQEQPPEPFDAALIKCGRWGTLAIEREDRSSFIPVFLAKAVSAVGSGDCFAGAVAGRLAAGSSVQAAAEAGAAAASLFVEREGNIPPAGLTTGVDEVLAARARSFVSPANVERIRVYLAGPWFSAAEDLLIRHLEVLLGNLGLWVTSPRRDLGLLPEAPSHQEIVAAGRRDYGAIDDADLIVAVLDGRDPGTLMEVGYAIHAEKPIIGLSTLPEARPQPMREAGGVQVVQSISGLLEGVTGWVRSRYGR